MDGVIVHLDLTFEISVDDFSYGRRSVYVIVNSTSAYFV